MELSIGQGRIGTLPNSLSRKDIIARIKQSFGIDFVLVCGPVEGKVERIACLAGAGGSFLEDAISQKADLYLTGEIRHHDALRAVQANMTVVCVLHSNSERVFLNPFMKKLSEKCTGLPFFIAKSDRDPFQKW